MNTMFKRAVIFVVLIGISLAGCDSGSGNGRYSNVQLEFDEHGGVSCD